MALGIIGMNVLGTCIASVAAQKGVEVLCTDLDEEIVKGIEEGELAGYERGLQELFNVHVKKGLITVTSNYQRSIERASLLILTYETIERDQMLPDLRLVEKGIRNIGRYLRKDAVVILTGILPPGTAEKMETLLNNCLEERESKVKAYVVCAPQHPPYGKILDVLMSTHHYTIGSDEPIAMQRLMTEFAKNGVNPSRVRFENRKETELGAFLKIALDKTMQGCLHEMIRLSESFGCDTSKVMRTLEEKWQKPNFSYPGFLTGTPEENKLRELANIAHDNGLSLPIIEGTTQENSAHAQWMASAIKDLLTSEENHLLVLGLTPYGGTDQLRDNPSLEVIDALADENTFLDIFCKAERNQMKWRLFKKRDVTRCIDDSKDFKKAYDALIVLGSVEGINMQIVKKLTKNNPTMPVIDPYKLFIAKKDTFKDRYHPLWK